MSRTDLLTGLLREVSRSFYLTLRVLPGAIGPQVGLAYLLARATDTVADAGSVALEERLRCLKGLGVWVEGGGGVDEALLARVGGAVGLTVGERVLMGRVGEAMTLLAGLDPGDRSRIQRVLGVIISGQVLDLERFGGGGGVGEVRALGTAADLDDYTYRVAGCVGEFWTAMCCSHLFKLGAGEEDRLMGLGIRFGKGLQLVNILRDLPRDLRGGRCYLPAVELRDAGVNPSALLDPAVEVRVRGLYDRWLGLAWGHLRAGWDYTLALPRDQVRLRLACAWPLLLGVRTLTLLGSRSFLDPVERVKVTRSEVRAVLGVSGVALLNSRWWESLFDTVAGWEIPGLDIPGASGDQGVAELRPPRRQD